ncbi:hypothetical protein DK37_13300 [Halomonas sp. SUBG004]|nr:hypothetical protein DK37_13300 [Halomonas sp. SUBG004]
MSGASLPVGVVDNAQQPPLVAELSYPSGQQKARQLLPQVDLIQLNQRIKRFLRIRWAAHS